VLWEPNESMAKVMK